MPPLPSFADNPTCMVKKKDGSKPKLASKPSSGEELITKIVEPRCSVCTHPDLKGINQRLLTDEPVNKIAASHSLGYRSLLHHKNNHLTKEIAHLELERQKRISTDVHTFADETYLSPIDKVRLAQDHLIKLLESHPTPSDETKDRIAILKEWHTSVSLEAKLLGLYHSAKGNDSSHIHNRIASLTIATVRKQKPDSDQPSEADPSNSAPSPQGRSLALATETRLIAEQICNTFNYIYGVDVAIVSEVLRLIGRKEEEEKLAREG